MSIATPSRRVEEQTDERVNEKIQFDLQRNLAYFANHLDEIDARLDELDREWDIERMLETMSATVSLSGLLLAVLRRQKRWLLVPMVVQSLFLQHAIQGWCPPLPVLRRLGFRTPREIDDERSALKAVRGDFNGVGESRDGTIADAARAAVER